MTDGYFYFTLFGPSALLIACAMYLSDSKEDSEKEITMNTIEKPYEIFRDDNGKLLAVIHGADNAYLSAKRFANELETKIGRAKGDGPAIYCEPTRATTWIAQQRLKDNAPHLLDALERLLDSTDSNQNPVSDEAYEYALNTIREAKGY